MRCVSTLSVCPSAVVDAPIDRVWDLVTDPEGFDLWTDAKLVVAEPSGPAAAGQELHLVTRALGWTFAVRISVREVDEERRRLHFLVALPFGIVNDEVMTFGDAGDGRTLVRFG
jgi:uncharacterized protein YndB with AHSA1/START domain